MNDIRRLNTTLSLEAYRILEKYREEYGSQKKTIEAALHLLDKDRCRLKSDHDRIWFAIREELNGVAIGKQLLRYLIENKKEEALKSRSVDRIVEWMIKKPIEAESRDNIISALKLIYEATNLFEHIDVVQEPDGTYSLTFYHSLGMDVSRFYSEYFRYFFSERVKADVKTFVRDSHFILFVR